MIALDLADRSVYSFWSGDVIRFADLDRLGHVNNVAFAVYAESGRIAFLEHVAPGSTAGTGIGWVIVKLHVDFLAQAHFPGNVAIGTRVLKLGRSSCTLGQGLFEGDRCFGRVESVCVWADVRNGKSLPLSDELRAGLEVFRQGPADLQQ